MGTSKRKRSFYRRQVLKELHQGKEDNKMLESKLDLKEKRHHAELENLKSSILNVKKEHLSSITKRLETSFEEKVFYQMKTKQLEEMLKKKKKEIMNIKNKIMF